MNARGSDRLLSLPQAAKKDRHCVLSKCLHMPPLPPPPAAKPAVPESQKRAINNTTDFHLAANTFIVGDRKSFLTHFTPWKNPFALGSSNWHGLQERCWCTREPRPETIYLHPCCQSMRLEEQVPFKPCSVNLCSCFLGREGCDSFCVCF